MTAPVDPAGLHVTANIYKQPWGFGQIEKGTKCKFNIPLVARSTRPESKSTAPPVRCRTPRPLVAAPRGDAEVTEARDVWVG